MQGRRDALQARIDAARTELNGLEGVKYVDLNAGPNEVVFKSVVRDSGTRTYSFRLDEIGEDGVRVLGDVVIAPAVAVANRPEDPVSELRLLLVHGILHLLGHDHEDEDDRATMWAKQERYTGVRVP